VTLVDPAIAFNARAVVPPRRVTVRLSLVRGDTASSPRALDLIPETPGRRVSFTLGGRTSAFDVTLERPEPPRTGRDSALATEAAARPRHLPPPRRADAGGLLLRQVLRARARFAPQGQPPALCDDAGVRQGARVPRRHR